jgi:hypothetical protein
MSGTITVNMTMFADRFFLEWTIQTPVDSINKKLLTGFAAGIALK